jgi:hypothetical protein
MNYAQLVTAIEDYTETNESVFVSQIPNFVQLAEERIYNSVDLPSLRKNSIGTTTSGNKYLSAPGDFLSVYSLAVVNPDTGEYEYLLNKDVNFIRQAYPSPTDQGIPKYYAIFGPTTTNDNPPVLTDELSFIFGPTPAAAYTVELHYFFYPESIVTAGTSWIGDNFESALLYGALREAVIFQKGEADMVSYYEKMYMESLGLLKNLGDGKLRRDAYRSGQVRIPVR